MAKSKPLQEVIAEMKIKDLASKNLDKIDRKTDQSIKSFRRQEKQIKKTDKQLSNFGRGFKKRMAGGLGGVGRAGRRVGGAFRGGIGGIPIIGGVIAAALASISSARDQFVAGISLRRELKELQNNYQAAFQKQADKTINDLRQGGLFRREDIQAALTNLRDAGVGPEAINQNAKILRQFTQAQGFTTLQQGIGALQGGKFRAGRGLSAVQIKQLEQLAPLLQDVASAPMAFERMINILNSASGNMQNFAKQTNEMTGQVVKTSNTMQDMQQKTVKLGAESEKLSKTFVVSERATRLQQETARSIARETAPVVGKGLEAVRKGIDFVSGLDTGKTVDKTISSLPGVGGIYQLGKKFIGGGRAGGGNVNVGSSYMVGERGPERFTPTTSGKITPTSQLGRQQITMNNTFNITTNGNNISNDIVRQVQQAIDQLGRTSMRYNSGLALRG